MEKQEQQGLPEVSQSSEPVKQQLGGPETVQTPPAGKKEKARRWSG
ncbi:hypothetical protein HMSSN139_58860 [Paenibacillus sp. HMSSN-139]|nr:hypothetical protein HMSSN139_58860 [Paenibacillus sp. HMSSN-139]